MQRFPFFFLHLLFGSLKTRGLFLARSSASFSFCALSGRGQKNSLNAKEIEQFWLNIFSLCLCPEMI